MTTKKYNSIFIEADNIVNKRNEERTRQYGDFNECMERAAIIATGSTGQAVTAENMFMYMIALKLARESHAHKRDNILDGIAYLGAYENYINKNYTNTK